MAEYGVTSRDLEVSLGVSRQAVIKWRHGTARPTPDRAREIERKFNIPKHLLRPDIWEPPQTKGRRSETANAC